MVRSRLAMLLASACTGVVLTAAAGRAEDTATKTKLPDPVAAAFKAAFPQGEIQKVDAEVENGVTIYDFEFKDGDTEKETDIAADGTMLEYTVVIAADAVPAAAMTGIKKYAKGATIGRCEHIEGTYETKDGKNLKLAKPVTRYAAEMTKGKLKAEVIVNPDGSVAEAPEWVKAEPAPAPKTEAKTKE